MIAGVHDGVVDHLGGGGHHSIKHPGLYPDQVVHGKFLELFWVGLVGHQQGGQPLMNLQKDITVEAIQLCYVISGSLCGSLADQRAAFLGDRRAVGRAVFQKTGAGSFSLHKCRFLRIVYIIIP